jgi:hypothetical protein
MHTSRELQDLLLCKDCEEALNDGGESWLLPKLAEIDGRFPLLDILESGPPSYSSDGNIYYEATKNPEIPVEKITHFAMGVFWKASAHSWSGTEKNPLIQLGPYAEPLRLFLTGTGPYPDHMSLQVYVSPRDKLFIGLTNPFQGSASQCHNFIFLLPGMEFSLYVGKMMPEVARLCSFYEHPAHPILVHDIGKKATESGRKAASMARKSARILREEARHYILQ